MLRLGKSCCLNQVDWLSADGLVNLKLALDNTEILFSGKMTWHVRFFMRIRILRFFKRSSEIKVSVCTHLFYDSSAFQMARKFFATSASLILAVVKLILPLWNG